MFRHQDWQSVPRVRVLQPFLQRGITLRITPTQETRMSDGFTKLFSSIVTSSIWSEDDTTRIVWITMLALADADGYVSASVPGLATLAHKSIEDTQKALDKLAAPDLHSRTPDNEGRRIHAAEKGGWFILNYKTYRERASIEQRRLWKREYMRDYMSRVRHGESNGCLTTSNRSLTSASASSSDTLEGGAGGDMALAKSFLEAMSKANGRKLIAKPDKTAVWIKKLFNRGVPEEEIRKTIDWLEKENPGREYRFVVASGQSLYEKWDRIQAAMTKPKSPPKPQGRSVYDEE